MRVQAVGALCAGLLLWGGNAARAAEDGNWQVRARLIDVAPDAKGTDALIDVDVEDDLTVEVDFTRYLTDHLELELIVATASQEVKIGDTSLGSVNHLPPTLTLQWHFMNREATFQPYVGAGANATFFYRKCGLLDELDLDSSFGFAAQVGADIKLSDKALLNFDLKYIDISTDVESDGDKLGTIDINPWVFGVGLGCRF
jgi:outer membrane protein